MRQWKHEAMSPDRPARAAEEATWGGPTASAVKVELLDEIRRIDAQLGAMEQQIRSLRIALGQNVQAAAVESVPLSSAPGPGDQAIVEATDQLLRRFAGR